MLLVFLVEIRTFYSAYTVDTLELDENILPTMASTINQRQQLRLNSRAISQIEVFPSGAKKLFLGGRFGLLNQPTTVTVTVFALICIRPIH